MKTLSTRELRVNIGKLTNKDCPVIITNRGKEIFVLEEFNLYNQLATLKEFDAQKLHRENQLLREALTNLGKNPSKILDEADEAGIETKPLGDDWMEKLGLKTADEFFN